ncbi:hypothetical protein BC828DRAFT_392369 [Blastocladiella britannica]|nr:hypothetical protein BC828DRAFT_392369 [Blastocladiella britannica]
MYLTELEFTAALARLPDSPLGTRPRLVRDKDTEQVVAVTNTAYIDEHWFKTPVLFERTNAAKVRGTANGACSVYFCLDGKDALAAAACIDGHGFDGTPALSALSVHPDFRMRGVGRYLTLAALHLARFICQRDSVSPQRLIIEVVDIKVKMLVMYERMGFRRFTTRTWEEYGLDPSHFTKECHLVVFEHLLEGI